VLSFNIFLDSAADGTTVIENGYNGQNNCAFEEVPAISVVMRTNYTRKQATKRLSLPSNINLPASFLRKHPINGETPMTRRLRRASMVRLGTNVLFHLTIK